MKKFPVFYRNRFSSVAARFKAWVYSHALAGIAGSNPAGGMEVRLLCLFCFVRYRSFDGPIPCQEESYRLCACEFVSLRVVSSNNNPLHLQRIVTSCQTKKGRRNFRCKVYISLLFCL